MPHVQPLSFLGGTAGCQGKKLSLGGVFLFFAEGSLTILPLHTSLGGVFAVAAIYGAGFLDAGSTRRRPSLLGAGHVR